MDGDGGCGVRVMWAFRGVYKLMGVGDVWSLGSCHRRMPASGAYTLMSWHGHFITILHPPPPPPPPS